MNWMDEKCPTFDRIGSCDGIAPTSEDFDERGCVDCPKLFKDSFEMLESGIELNIRDLFGEGRYIKKIKPLKREEPSE